MNALNKTVETLIQASTTTSHSEPHVCKHCGEEVPPIEVEVLGRKRMVQPVCECEAKEQDKFKEEAEKYQLRKDVEKLFSIHNLGERFKESSLEKFEVKKGTERVYKAVKKYIEDFEEWGPNSLMIWGNCGNGKSLLASAVANELDKKNYIVVFQSVPELLTKIKSTFNKESKETQDSIMKALMNCDLLILDDIGAEKLTEWVAEKIFEIIDGRYRRKKPIFYTSNLRPSELSEKVGARSYDRMLETSLIIENKATSYRKEIAENRKKRFLSYLEEN